LLAAVRAEVATVEEAPPVGIDEQGVGVERGVVHRYGVISESRMTTKLRV
jgi:hypothetical protein